MTHIRFKHSRLDWAWVWWQWRGTPYSPTLQHDWSLTIRLFSVISRLLIVGGVLHTQQRCSQYILQLQPTGLPSGIIVLTFLLLGFIFMPQILLMMFILILHRGKKWYGSMKMSPKSKQNSYYMTQKNRYQDEIIKIIFKKPEMCFTICFSKNIFYITT